MHLHVTQLCFEAQFYEAPQIILQNFCESSSFLKR